MNLDENGHLLTITRIIQDITGLQIEAGKKVMESTPYNVQAVMAENAPGDIPKRTNRRWKRE